MIRYGKAFYYLIQVINKPRTYVSFKVFNPEDMRGSFFRNVDVNLIVQCQYLQDVCHVVRVM
jgi:hypothetical protein